MKPPKNLLLLLLDQEIRVAFMSVRTRSGGRRLCLYQGMNLRQIRVRRVASTAAVRRRRPRKSTSTANTTNIIGKRQRRRTIGVL
jgi:hypothetical protein